MVPYRVLPRVTWTVLSRLEGGIGKRGGAAGWALGGCLLGRIFQLGLLAIPQVGIEGPFFGQVFFPTEVPSHSESPGGEAPPPSAFFRSPPQFSPSSWPLQPAQPGDDTPRLSALVSPF